jgi:hypothetical protein
MYPLVLTTNSAWFVVPLDNGRGAMNSVGGHLTPSGVLIAADFRANLIIDRYDPVFADMRASKTQTSAERQ